MRNPKEVFINGTSLQDILVAHYKWVIWAVGSISDLSRVNLSEVNLIRADLTDANLRYADLSRADLRRANLRKADLSGANLNGANLREADLSDASLNGAKLCGSDLTDANLRYADLSRADLTGANLRGADLTGANLSQIIYDYNTMPFAIQCPEEGSFIGYKKCKNFIVKLEIPSDAKRSSATSRKCRCSKAKILSITNLDGSASNILAIASDFDPNFIYTVEEIVEVKDFDENRWHECSSGIHFFITRNEAVSY